jgi:hypothetical protein
MEVFRSKWIEENEASIGSTKEYWMEAKKKSRWVMKDEVKIVGVLELEIFYKIKNRINIIWSRSGFVRNESVHYW